jgi:hypothetical protein
LIHVVAEREGVERCGFFCLKINNIYRRDLPVCPVDFNRNNLKIVSKPRLQVIPAHTVGVKLRGTLCVFSFRRFFFSFRQIVARTILETLRVVTGQPENVTAVLNVMKKLADDCGQSNTLLHAIRVLHLVDFN